MEDKYTESSKGWADFPVGRPGTNADKFGLWG